MIRSARIAFTNMSFRETSEAKILCETLAQSFCKTLNLTSINDNCRVSILPGFKDIPIAQVFIGSSNSLRINTTYQFLESRLNDHDFVLTPHNRVDNFQTGFLIQAWSGETELEAFQNLAALLQSLTASLHVERGKKLSTPLAQPI